MDPGGDVHWPAAAKDALEAAGPTPQETTGKPSELEELFQKEIDLRTDALFERYPELKDHPDIDRAKIRAAFEAADREWNTEIKPADIARITEGISERRSVPEPEVDRMMGLIDRWYEERALDLTFPKPTHVLIARGGYSNVSPVFRADAVGLFAHELTKIYEGTTDQSLWPEVTALRNRWSMLPKRTRMEILNAELTAMSLPELPAEEAATAISFNWVHGQLNGAPFLFKAKRHRFLDLFRVPPITWLDNAKDPPRRSEMHPLVLDEKGYLRRFNDLGEVEALLKASHTALPNVNDPRTTELHLFKFTNSSGRTVVVFRSGPAVETR
jgi:hypothetical protein